MLAVVKQAGGRKEKDLISPAKLGRDRACFVIIAPRILWWSEEDNPALEISVEITV